MSTNTHNPGPNTGRGGSDQSPSRTEPGMEVYSSRNQSQYSFDVQNTTSANMSTLVSRPFYTPPLSHDMNRSERRPSHGPRSYSQQNGILLPSIRDVCPNLLRGDTDAHQRTESPASYSPVPRFGQESPPAQKRRRLSEEENRDYDSRERERNVRRMYSPSRTSYHPHSATVSPTFAVRRPSIPPSSENWHLRMDSYGPAVAAAQPLPVSRPSLDRDWETARVTLPSIPSLSLGGSPTTSPVAQSPYPEYLLHSSRSHPSMYPPPSSSSFEAPQQQIPVSAYPQPQPQPPSYGYEQPRGQSFSGPFTYPSQDRTPFSNSHQNLYISGFPYGVDPNDAGNEAKQRKRRGNLPKETTDRLKIWFEAHLHHPYPTEDEKQALMQQTGLQMNQISNWFINARRRLLPNLINNARAEANSRMMRDRQSGRVGPGLSPPESPDTARNVESDGDGEAYDEEYDVRLRSGIPSASGPPKRESI